MQEVGLAILNTVVRGGCHSDISAKPRGGGDCQGKGPEAEAGLGCSRYRRKLLGLEQGAGSQRVLTGDAGANRVGP